MSYVFNAFSKATIPQFPMIMADHATLIGEINGFLIALYNGADIKDTRKGLNDDSIWLGLLPEQFESLQKLDNDLLGAIHVWLSTNAFLSEREPRTATNNDDDEYTREILGVLQANKDWSGKINIPDDKKKDYVIFKINKLRELIYGLRDTDLINLILNKFEDIYGEGHSLYIYLKNPPTDDKILEPLAIKSIDGIADKSSYYIHQVIGNLIDQQPFGGFILPHDLAYQYKSIKAFEAYLQGFAMNVIESGGYVFGCENAGTFEHDNHSSIQVSKKDKVIKNLNKKLEKKDGTSLQVFGVHLPSSGDNRELLYNFVTDKYKELKEKGEGEEPFIVLGDTNITESKLEGEEPPFNLQASAQEMSKRTGKKVSIVMRNVVIKKGRGGGPFMNTQIYKSGVITKEQDGMMVIVIGNPCINFDTTHEIISASPGEAAEAALGAAAAQAALGEGAGLGTEGGGAGLGSEGLGASPGGGAAEGGGRVRKARKSRKAKKHSKRARRGGSRKNKSKKQKKSRKN